jgi:hypothetical protein
MRNALKVKQVILILILSLFLMGADNVEQRGDERNALMDRQKTLQVRIKTLQAEQDFLLFQKAMYTADSKYLVLKMTEKAGQLKYKNRVMKDFQFITPKNASGKKLRTGMLTLTKKREGKGDRHALVFGSDLILKRKNTVVPPQEAGINALFLKKKDMDSLFSAVEVGALIYILP